jgi:mono/diheme cytochrome c family protein
VLLALLLALSRSGAAGDAPPAAPEGVVDFVRDVQPIFEANCWKCHGAEKQKGGYRLDVKQSAFTGGDHSAPKIVPGKSAESPLLKYVSGKTRR